MQSKFPLDILALTSQWWCLLGKVSSPCPVNSAQDCLFHSVYIQSVFCTQLQDSPFVTVNHMIRFNHLFQPVAIFLEPNSVAWNILPLPFSFQILAVISSPLCKPVSLFCWDIQYSIDSFRWVGTTFTRCIPGDSSQDLRYGNDLDWWEPTQP